MIKNDDIKAANNSGNNQTLFLVKSGQKVNEDQLQTPKFVTLDSIKNAFIKQF